MNIIFVDRSGREKVFRQESELLAALLNGELNADTLVRTAPDAQPARLGDTDDFRLSVAADWDRKVQADRTSARRYRWIACAGLVLGLLIGVGAGVASHSPELAGQRMGHGLFVLLLAWLATRVLLYRLGPPAKSLITLVLVAIWMCWSVLQSVMLYQQHQRQWMVDLGARLSARQAKAREDFTAVAGSVDLKHALSPDQLVDAGRVAHSRDEVARLRSALTLYEDSLHAGIQAVADAAEINLRDAKDRAGFNAGVAQGMREDAEVFDFLEARKATLDRLDTVLRFCQQRAGGIRIKGGQLAFDAPRDAVQYQEALSGFREAARQEALLRDKLAASPSYRDQPLAPPVPDHG